MQFKSSPSKDSKISFPKLESWNPMHNVATIAVDIDKTRVLCRISRDVLRLFCTDKAVDPMLILKDHRSIFEDKALKLIEDKAFEKDGSLVIRKADI